MPLETMRFGVGEPDSDPRASAASTCSATVPIRYIPDDPPAYTSSVQTQTIEFEECIAVDVASTPRTLDLGARPAKARRRIWGSPQARIRIRAIRNAGCGIAHDASVRCRDAGGSVHPAGIASRIAGLGLPAPIPSHAERREET